jgi:TRAP-type mannitol/chloroaromatic compound transport system permease small subunit
MFLIPVFCFAAGSDADTGPATFPNPIAAPDLTSLLTLVLNAVILIVFPFIVLFIVYAGFKMVAARGNPGEISKAKEQIIYAIIGALIILGAGAISLAIKGTVNQIRCDQVDNCPGDTNP